MSKLTVTSFSTAAGVQDWKGTVAYLQLFYAGGFNGQAFSFSTGEVWSPSRDNFYREIECDLDGNVITVPTFLLDTTTDVIGQPGVTLMMRIQQARHRGSNEPDILLADQWQVPAVLQGLTVVTFEMLRQFNNPVRHYMQDTSQVSRSQVAQMISDAVNVGNPMTVDALGRGFVDTPPDDPARPILVGVNSPRVPSAQIVYYADVLGLPETLAAVGSAPARVVVGQSTSAAGVTFPENITLEMTGGAQLTGSGTVTIRGPFVAERRRVFASGLTASFSGNHTVTEVYPEWWGAKADGVTDCTAAIQAAVDALDASNLSGTVKFALGVYVIAGALRDTSGANAQLLLPARTTMLSLRFEGSTPSQTVAFTRNDTGSVLRSTLASGTGNVVGAYGSFTIADVANNTALSFHWENLSLQLPDNPTNSGLDLTRVPNVRVVNAQISTSVDPSALANITEPTTATSYGLKLAPNNVPDLARVENVQIYGFYNAARAGELALVDNLFVTFCKVAVEVPNAYHPYLFGRVWIGYCPRGFKFTGGAGAGLIGAIVEVAQASFEHQTSPAWVTSVADVDDGSNNALGRIRFNLVKAGLGASALLNVNGALYVNLEHSVYSWNSRWNIIQPHGTFDVQDNAVFEVARRTPTSDDTLFAALHLVTRQSGVNNLVGHVTGINSALATAEKRVAVMGMRTDGATDSGRIEFTTWNAGAAGLRMLIDRDGVSIYGLPVYANNAAAVAGGLAVGDLYRAGGDPDAVCVVH